MTTSEPGATPESQPERQPEGNPAQSEPAQARREPAQARREPAQQRSNVDKIVLTIGAAAAVVAIIAIFVDQGQLRTAARLLLYATVALGIILAAWAGWNLTRTDGRRFGGGNLQTVVVWASVLVILMPLTALILRHHEKLVNCKDARKLVRPVAHRQLYPPYSREEKKCAINTYIEHLNKVGTTTPHHKKKH